MSDFDPGSHRLLIEPGLPTRCSNCLGMEFRSEEPAMMITCVGCGISYLPPGHRPAPVPTVTYPDSFADYPKSISAVRADKSESSRDWSPRDALIDALGRIDTGELKPMCLSILIATENEDGSDQTTHVIRAGRGIVLDGLLLRAMRVTE